MRGIGCSLLVSGLAVLPLIACSGSDGEAATFGTTGITSLGGDDLGDGTDADDADDGSTGPLLDSLAGDESEATGVDTEGCGAVSEEAQNELAPVDIVIIIDTSGSMSDEKNFVQQNMNIFSQQIFLANIDHHVVVIAESSPDGPCIGLPLGSGACPGDTKLPEYLHVVENVGSSNALDIILATHQTWATSIRPNSIKHLVVVSDDDSATGAAAFDAAFKALDPNYADYFFHAIVAYEAPNPLECIGGASCCSGLIPLSADVGSVYLELVNSTGGVSGDLCDQQFGPVFSQIAQSVQANTPLACEWDIPEPPEGESFDPTKVNVELTLDGMVESVFFLDSEAECQGGDGWFYFPDNIDPQTIRICPSTCARTQDAVEASVDILFGCDTIPVG